jgi:hypothetical protein
MNFVLHDFWSSCIIGAGAGAVVGRGGGFGAGISVGGWMLARGGVGQLSRGSDSEQQGPLAVAESTAGPDQRPEMGSLRAIVSPRERGGRKEAQLRFKSLR